MRRPDEETVRPIPGQRDRSNAALNNPGVANTRPNRAFLPLLLVLNSRPGLLTLRRHQLGSRYNDKTQPAGHNSGTNAHQKSPRPRGRADVRRAAPGAARWWPSGWPGPSRGPPDGPAWSRSPAAGAGAAAPGPIRAAATPRPQPAPPTAPRRAAAAGDRATGTWPP